MRSVLVTLATEDYLDHAKVVFIDSVRLGGWAGDFCLLKYGEKSEADNWFINNGIFVFYIEKLAWDKGSKLRDMLLSKFNICHPFMKKWDKLLFLDCDVVINGPLNGLLRYRGHHAVIGIKYPHLRDRLSRPKFKDISKWHSYFFLKFISSGPGYNGGVYLIDLNELDENTFKDGVTYFNKHKHSLSNAFADEALFSSFFRGEIKPLPLCYNVYVPHYNTAQGIILHYLGGDKPWMTTNPMNKRYKQSLELSKAFGEVKSERDYNMSDIKRLESEYQNILLPIFLEISKLSIYRFKDYHT